MSGRQQRQEEQPSLLDQYLASKAERQRREGDPTTEDGQAAQQQRLGSYQELHSSSSSSSSASHRGGGEHTTLHASNATAQLTENSHCLRLCLDLPGVEAKDVEVTIHQGVLDIRGVRKTWSMNGNTVIKKLKFVRKFAIDTRAVEVEHTQANLNKGVLVVSAPKRSRPQCIRVRVSEEGGEHWNPFPEEEPSSMQVARRHQEQIPGESENGSHIRPDGAPSSVVPVAIPASPEDAEDSKPRGKSPSSSTDKCEDTSGTALDTSKDGAQLRSLNCV